MIISPMQAAGLATILRQRVIADRYDRALIVVNRNAARAVASTVERFALQHYIAGPVWTRTRVETRPIVDITQAGLLPSCQTCWNCNCWGGKKKRTAKERNTLKTPPTWRNKRGGPLLKAVFASAASAGRDTYGVGYHFDTWAAAQNDTARFPPILFLDVATFLKPQFTCLLAAFIGANVTSLEQRLRTPTSVSARTWHHAASHLDAAAFMTPQARSVYEMLSRRISDTVDRNYRSYTRRYGCPEVG